MNTKNKITFPNLHYGLLRKICQLKPHIIAKQYGLVEHTTSMGRYWYKDNNASVLAVFHSDTVNPFSGFGVNRLKSDTMIMCPTLDDRLGGYIILEWLQTAGLKFDILMTEGEEQRYSTAAAFKPPKGKEYNWVFSFDRRGSDVALYQYNKIEPLMTALTLSGFDIISHGSYSDIVELEDLSVGGVNFGCGYMNNHSESAWFSKKILLSQLRKFLDFYVRNRNTKFIFPEKDKIYKSLEEVGPSEDKYQFEIAFKDGVYSSVEKHRKDSEKSKIQQIKEFIEAKKAKEQTALSMKKILESDISTILTDIPVGLVMKLYNAGIITIGQLVRFSRVELIRFDKSIVMEDAINLKAMLEPYGLSFAMNPSKFGAVIRDIVKPVKKEESLAVTTEIKNKGMLVSPEQSLVLAVDDKDSTKEESKQDTSSKNKVLVQHPLPLTDKSIKKAEKVEKHMDECIRCFAPTAIEDLSDNFMCPSCEKEHGKKMEENAEKQRTCPICGDVKPIANFFSTEICNSCQLASEIEETAFITFSLDIDAYYTRLTGWQPQETESNEKQVAAESPTKEAMQMAFEEKAKDKKAALKLEETLKGKKKNGKKDSHDSEFMGVVKNDPLAPFQGTLREKLIKENIFSLEKLQEKTKKDLHFLTTKELSTVKNALKENNLKLKKALPAIISRAKTKLKQVGFSPEEA